jgi:hypothetical protein
MGANFGIAGIDWQQREMLIVKKDGIEIVSNFPVKQITAVDPIPGYGDHVK